MFCDDPSLAAQVQMGAAGGQGRSIPFKYLGKPGCDVQRHPDALPFGVSN